MYAFMYFLIDFFLQQLCRYPYSKEPSRDQSALDRVSKGCQLPPRHARRPGLGYDM